MDWAGNMVFLEKLDFGDLAGIMGFLWGYLNSKLWVGQIRDTGVTKGEDKVEYWIGRGSIGYLG